MRTRIAAFCAALVILATFRVATACPFCAATSPTICEELAPAEVIVTARLISFEAARQNTAVGKTTALGVARYEIVEVLRGRSAINGVRRIEVSDASLEKPGTARLFTGCGAPKITWSQSHPVSSRAQEYVRRAMALPTEGSKRLAFFHDYLEDAEELLAEDAYNEFASAPYAEVKKLRGIMDRERLARRLADPKTPANRRGLLLTMLGVCGTPDDVPLLEDLLRRGSRENSGSFDAVLAAYLTLRAEAGLDEIDARFLRADTGSTNPESADSHAAVRALRFHLEEQHGAPRPRILASLRLLLDRPEMASVVIADLARWEDWQALPKLVELFKQAATDESGLRVQVVNYLLSCPLPEAGRQLDELARIAPKDVARARILGVYGRTPQTAAPLPPQP